MEAPPGQDPADLLAPLRAVQLERERAVRGDAAVLTDLLALVPSRRYDVGDAWVLGRLGRAASDSLQARFLAAEDRGAQGPLPDAAVLLHRHRPPIPLLSRVYAAPDSFGVPVRYGIARLGRAALDRHHARHAGAARRPAAARARESTPIPR